VGASSCISARISTTSVKATISASTDDGKGGAASGLPSAILDLQDEGGPDSGVDCPCKLGPGLLAKVGDSHRAWWVGFYRHEVGRCSTGPGEQN